MRRQLVACRRRENLVESIRSSSGPEAAAIRSGGDQRGVFRKQAAFTVKRLMSAASALMLDNFPIHGWPATHGDKSAAPATRNAYSRSVFLEQHHALHDCRASLEDQAVRRHVANRNRPGARITRCNRSDARLRGPLVGVSQFDPITFVGVIATLAVAGALGCAIPPRRAVRMDPVVALRCE